MAITLVLTRKPDELFSYPSSKGTLHGRFGTLLVLEGDKLAGVQISPDGPGSGAISVPTGVLDITPQGATVQELGRYTTIERMDGMVQLPPLFSPQSNNRHTPYGITYETGNTAVAELKGTNGECFRVHGGITSQQQGILIHAAPHVGWLIGCIGPRRWNDRATETESCWSAMKELFQLVGQQPADLFVVDW